MRPPFQPPVRFLAQFNAQSIPPAPVAQSSRTPLSFHGSKQDRLHYVFFSLRLSGNSVEFKNTVISIVECPNCYTHVIPTSAGECPACRKDMTSAAGTESDKTSFSINHAAKLSPYCCGCGCHADRYVKVARHISRERDERDSSNDVLTVLILTVGWIVLPLVWMFGLRHRIGDVIVVRMPQCNVCASNGPPIPISVNSEELRMTFVVHKQFKEANQPPLQGSEVDTAEPG